MGIKNLLKNLFKPKDDDDKKRRNAQRITNYGGGVSVAKETAGKQTQKEISRGIKQAQEKQKQTTQTTQTTTPVQSAFKATPPSVRKAETRDNQTQKKTSSKHDAFNKANAFKARQEISRENDPKTARVKDKSVAEMRRELELKKKRRERLAGWEKKKVDAKYKAGSPETKLAMKTGEYASDPDVARYELLKHPVVTSAARGATSGATLGLPDLLAARATKGEAKKTEEFYQKNKSEAAEGLGRFAGAMIPYAGTAGAFEGVGTNVIGRAAETQLGKRLGAEALARTMAGNGAKAALTRSLVGDTIQDSTLGLVDTLTDVAARDDLETTGDYVKAILQGQALNYGMGLAGNAVFHGAPIAREAWSDFADESRKLRFVPKDVSDFMDDFVSDLDNSAYRLNPVMNGGTTKANRLQGVSYENGYKPKRLSKDAALARPPKANIDAEPPKTSKAANAVAAKEIKKPADVMQGYSSKGSKKKISDVKKRAQSLIANGDEDGARREISRVVDEIARDARVVAPLDDTTKEIKEYLKNAKISVSDKADIGYKSGSFDAFRKKHFGSLNLTENGRPVDDLWGELQERYGTSIFPDEIENPSDQLRFLSDLAKKTNGKEYELADDELLNLKNELNDSLWHAANEKPAKGKSAKAAESKGAKKVVNDSRYDELTAERKRLIDEIFSKNERTDPAIRKRIEEIDEELKGIKPPKSKKTKTKKGAKEAAETLEPKAQKSKTDVDTLKTYKENRAKSKAQETATPEAETPRQQVRKAKTEAAAEAKTEAKAKKAKSSVGNKIYTVEVEGARGKRTVEVEAKSRREAMSLATNEKGDRWGRVVGEKEIKPKAEPPKAKVEEPETGIVAKSEAAGAGEKAKTGERTEFKRSEEATAKEQARSKRAKRDTAKVTQESFDKDFAAFEKKIGESQAKADNLRGRIRVAKGAEKEALQKELDALKAEIKSEYNRASLRYHPDRGGSNEWMGQFNKAYDDFRKGNIRRGESYKSAESSTRTRTDTGARYKKTAAGAGGNGGGNTPPPPRGGIGNYDGLRRPKGYAKRTQRAMHSVEDMVGASKTKKGVRETLRQFKDEADRKFVDSMKDFEGVARERKKTEGKGAMQKLYGAIDKARRYRAIATTSVGSHQLKADGTRYKIIDANGVERDAPSLAEIFSFKGDKAKEKSFNAYLLLNHNVDRLREGTPIFENTVIYNEELSKRLGLPKDIDLMDADVCKKLAEDYEARFPEFKDRAAQVRQYTANELNNRVEAGLLPKEKMDEWLHDHPNYVPTYRDGLFDGVGTNRNGAIGASDLKAAKGSDLNIYDIKEQLADATVRNWRDMTLNNVLEETFGENVAKMARSTDVDPYTFALDHTMNVSKSADGGKYYADIYRNGKAERIEIEKRFYDDLKDLYKNGRMGNGLDGLNDKVLVPLANTWKKLITEWSPIFMVKNAMRDYPEAIINSRNRKEFLQITADFSALKDLVGGGKFSSSLRDAGISSSTFIDIDKAVKAWEKGDGSLKDLIPRLNAGVEMYPRLVEYMATIKKAGYDLKTVNIEDIPMSVRDMAAANAADVTVNFGRSGSVGKMINKGAIPFFNPSVQGWSKFARNVTELDGMKDTLGFLAATTALGTAPMVATNLLYQNNPNYQQISARDKANNYIIAIPPLSSDTDKFLKIPRSRFASVYGLPLVNVANENKMGWGTAIQVVNDQVAPLNPLESHLGANLIQASRNKTWYGTPIESESMQNIPANERYDATTSGISIKAADMLDKASKGKVKVSPKKLDYVLDANLGVIADFALPATTQANKGTPVPKRLANVGKKAFTIDSAIQNDISSRYYEWSNKLQQNKNSKNATEEDKKAYEQFNSWNNRVKDVTNAMRYVQESDIPNKQDAYRELRKLRNEDMLKALDGRTSLNNTHDISVIHKYAGTSYTIENLGKSADKKALKAYGAHVYGDISEDEMKKKIDSDTEFYKGYKGIVKTKNALQKVSPNLKGDNALTYAVGLAEAGASKDVFASYDTTVKSRTESASKATRAKEYLKNNGSTDEFAQLENVIKNGGKVADVDKDRLEDEAYKKLQSGKISIEKYNTELKKIDYNANQSYVGKAISLAQAGAPNRAYNLYDIKDKNVQKGCNLAAMGIDSRKYREMSKACDKDGNGYLKTSEIRDYVANSDIEDKATLFDALCYYPNVRNPFGTPSRYSSKQAAEAGKRAGITQIKVNEGEDNTSLIESSSGNSGGYGGYYRGGRWHRWHRRGGGSKKTTAGSYVGDFKGGQIKTSSEAKAARVTSHAPSASRSSSASVKKPQYKSLAASLKTTSKKSASTASSTPVRYETAKAVKSMPKAKKKSATKATPPKVKFKKYEV